MPDAILARGASTSQGGSEAERRERFFEPGRLNRARTLAITKLGPRQYRVQGQDEPHYDVNLDVDPPCYCADQLHRGTQLGGNCKHVLAARLQERDPALVQAIVDDYLRRLGNGSLIVEEDA